MPKTVWQKQFIKPINEEKCRLPEPQLTGHCWAVEHGTASPWAAARKVGPLVGKVVAGLEAVAALVPEAVVVAAEQPTVLQAAVEAALAKWPSAQPTVEEEAADPWRH